MKSMEISVELEEISTVKKKLNVSIPEELAAKEFERVAKEYKRHARLPGFRPGKAPLGLVKRHFGQDIRGEVIKKLVPEAYQQAVREESVQPLGQPSLQNLKAEEGQPVTFEAHFEVKPIIELPECRGLELSVDSREVTEDDLQEQLERLRESHAQLVAVEDRPIEKGDTAIADIRGSFLDEGAPAEPIEEEDVHILVGDEGTHAAFTEQLLGINIGEEKTFEVEYADDYPGESLAGHRVSFTVAVTDIKQKILPELNDEFAKDVGDYATLDELKARILGELEQAQKQSRENEIRKAASKKLLELTPFEVPDVLVEERSDQRLRELAGKVMSQGIDPARANIDWRQIRKDMRPDVEDEVRTQLILDEIALAEDLEITAQEVDEEIDRLAASLEQPREKVSQAVREEDEGASLQSEMRRRKALGFVIEHAKVT
jgi:trigger factor